MVADRLNASAIKKTAAGEDEMGGEVTQRLARLAAAAGEDGSGRARLSGRRRDRHGRGLRGPLAPDDLPISRSRSDRFDELVLDAVERLEGRWAERLDGVEFGVEDVPPADTAVWSADPVPLSKLFPATSTQPPRIVLYRRPVEARAAGRDELRSLVHDIVVEEVAELFGMEPEVVDPRYASGEQD